MYSGLGVEAFVMMIQSLSGRKRLTERIDSWNELNKYQEENFFFRLVSTRVNLEMAMKILFGLKELQASIDSALERASFIVKLGNCIYPLIHLTPSSQRQSKASSNSHKCDVWSSSLNIQCLRLFSSQTNRWWSTRESFQLLARLASSRRKAMLHTCLCRR